MKMQIIKYNSVDSTNNVAIRRIKKGKIKPTLIVANSQKKGRGQYGRHWVSHKGNIFIYWDDNDANVNYENRRNNLIDLSKLAKVNICGTNLVEKYFQIVNIKYRKIVF